MSENVLFDTSLLLADIEWRPGFGARWLWWIAAAHLIAAWFCFSAGNRERTEFNGKHQSRQSWFWYVLATFMLMLCLNKVFDLQPLITIYLRQTARVDNWYSDRRSLQQGFLIGSAVVGILFLLASFFVLRGRWLQRAVAWFAAVFLLTLVVVRTASYHQVDQFLLALPGIGNRMNAGLELAGAILVTAGAFFASRDRVGIHANQNEPKPRL